MENRQKKGVFAAIRAAAGEHRLLTVGTLLCVAASVAESLLPPLVLARIIDRLTGGLPLSLLAALLYFGSLALEGILSSAQESLLVLFGQKMTHALRREMSQKLTQLPVATLVDQNPGEVAGRFSGDVDAVEALFTSGIISMVADACRILSILGVIAVKNTGLALVLLLVLPLLAVFTRHVQKRMLAAQMDHRHAVPPCPDRCRRRCTISAPSVRWGWRTTWSAAMNGASVTAMPPWNAPTSMTPSICRWCCCWTPWWWGRSCCSPPPATQSC